MSKFFIPTNTPEDWKPLLAEPDKHWKTGYSAKALAYAWQEADGFPPEVKRVFKNSGIAVFKDIKMLAAFPEYKVPLPGEKRAVSYEHAQSVLILTYIFVAEMIRLTDMKLVVEVHKI